MSQTIELPVKYILVAVNNNEVTVYYAIDQHSGYPYWSTFISSVHYFNSSKDASHAAQFSGVTYMLNEVADVRVGEAITSIKMSEVIYLTEANAQKVLDNKKQSALAKLSDEDRAILGV